MDKDKILAEGKDNMVGMVGMVDIEDNMIADCFC